MLRIIQTETAAERRWILCGQLAGRWVRELGSQWREFAEQSRASGEAGAASLYTEADPRRRVIDLTDVTFIDEDGEALLGQMEQQGVHLVAGKGVYNRDLLENLRTKGRRPVRRILGRTNETC